MINPSATLSGTNRNAACPFGDVRLQVSLQSSFQKSFVLHKFKAPWPNFNDNGTARHPTSTKWPRRLQVFPTHRSATFKCLETTLSRAKLPPLNSVCETFVVDTLPVLTYRHFSMAFAVEELRQAARPIFSLHPYPLRKIPRLISGATS